MKVAVLGATGVVGRNLVPRLLERGHTVVAGARRADQSIGVDVRIADIMDKESLVGLIRGSDVVVNLASSIPRPDGRSGSWKIFDEIRREGTRNLMRACELTEVPMIAQSVAMLHSADTTRPQTERDPLIGSAVLASGRDQETMLAEWDRPYRIVRGGSLYGPGTSMDDQLFEAYARGELRSPGDGTDWASLVHIADLAAAFLTVIERASERSVWIAADDYPMRWGEICRIVARLSDDANGAPGSGAERRLPSFRVSNEVLKTLGWQPRYASPSSGFVAAAERRRVR